jgi:hypothetical protein
VHDREQQLCKEVLASKIHAAFGLSGGLATTRMRQNSLAECQKCVSDHMFTLVIQDEHIPCLLHCNIHSELLL